MFRIALCVAIGVAMCAMPMESVNGQERAMELSLEESIDRALRENLNLKSYGLGLRSDDYSIERAKSIFDPSINLSVQRDESNSPNFYQYINASMIDQQVTRATMELSQKLVTGGNWGIGFHNTLSESNIEREKNYTSYFGVDFSQPLLRGFGKDIAKSNIYLARLSREETFQDVRSRAADLISSTSSAYWDLVYARATLDVRRMALAQAESLLVDNRAREDLGILTRSDVLEAESAMLQRRQEVLDQENLIRGFEDNLRRLMNMTANSDWETAIVTTTEPQIPASEVDIQSSYQYALQHRPDYLVSKKRLEQGQVSLDVAENNMRPNLDLNAGYRLNGSGAKYSDNIDAMTEFDQYGWSVGLMFSYPLGNRSAEAQYEQQQISIRQTELSIEDLETRIMREIRTAARNVLFFRKRIDDAQVAVEVNELKVRTEEERFRNQLSTSYYVLQFQNDLVNARNIYNKALIDYNLALTELQRVSGKLIPDNGISIIGLE